MPCSHQQLKPEHFSCRGSHLLAASQHLIYPYSDLTVQGLVHKVLYLGQHLGQLLMVARIAVFGHKLTQQRFRLFMKEMLFRSLWLNFNKTCLLLIMWSKPVNVTEIILRISVHLAEVEQALHKLDCFSANNHQAYEGKIWSGEKKLLPTI